MMLRHDWFNAAGSSHTLCLNKVTAACWLKVIERWECSCEKINR